MGQLIYIDSPGWYDTPTPKTHFFGYSADFEQISLCGYFTDEDIVPLPESFDDRIQHLLQFPFCLRCYRKAEKLGLVHTGHSNAPYHSHDGSKSHVG